jgi:predicted small lipoprotein YifL
MWRKRRGAIISSVLLTTLATLAGCAPMGPGMVPMDRAGYNDTITESWKQQILSNIVKIRYVEPMFFVDVGDIVAGYSMETTGSAAIARTWIDPKTLVDTSNLSLGVSGKYTDRPTITYKPMTGAPFRRAVMLPMPLRNVALGIESGISANFLVSLGVRSINGLRNEYLTPMEHKPAEDDFTRVVKIISQLQLANAVHVKNEPAKKNEDAKLVLLLGGMRPSAEVRSLISELQGLLDLDPALLEYELVGVPTSKNRGQIALQAYSMMQIMANVAARVDIPPEDIVSKRAVPSLTGWSDSGALGGVAVRCSTTKPEQAFAAINFHGRWFWVDDHDLATKRVFSFLMLAFTLMEESRGSTTPQLTIPVQ